LAEGYHTSSNPVLEGAATKLKFSAKAYFSISLFSVDVSNYNPGGTAVIKPQPPPREPASITLTSFVNGKKDKPVCTGSNSFTVSWTCNNCQPNTKYNVMLTEIGGGKYKDLSKKNLSANTVKFSDVPSGQFKIVVSAMNVNSAITFIETPSGGYGWLIFLLILGIVVRLIIYYRNRQREDSFKKPNPKDPHGIFDNNSSTGGKSSSSNTEF
jgi:hypothetical protein